MKEYTLKATTEDTVIYGEPQKDKVQALTALAIAVYAVPKELNITYSMVVREVSEWEEV